MKRKLVLLALATIALTSCGRDVAQALDRTLYHTTTFADNMYQDTVLSNQLAATHIASKTTYQVPNANVLNGVSALGGDFAAMNDETFSTTYKLSNTLPEIKYGFESKLFDGILHCSDAVRISKSRLQIEGSGFGYLFPKSLTSLDLVGLYLKAGADTSLGGVPITDVRIKLSFYLPTTSDQWQQHEFGFDIANIRQSDFPQYYGFYLSSVAPTLALAGASAISVQYQILDAAALASVSHYTALFVYELLLPNSRWN